MVSCLVRVTDKYLNSAHVSLQQEHIELYVSGKLFSLVLAQKDGSFLKEYRDADLSRLIGSAISRGRRQAENPRTFETEFYYLADR